MKEEKYSNKTIEQIIEQIENDPLGVEAKDVSEDSEMQKFIESQRKIGLNMAVVFYMIDALKFFENLSLDEIRKIGFEIAEYGRLGIDPNSDKKHILTSIPNRKFSGYHLLSYMYVSWATFDSSMVSQLGLPYDSEIKLAKQLFNSNKY